LDTQIHLEDPDPTLREMFISEHEDLLTEFDNLVTVILPQLILPPLPAASLPAIMTLTAGIGGGESARFLEDMSKMYTRHAENRGWRAQIISASEGAMAKGSGGNGYREMTIKFLPAEFAEEGAECFGELMWEKGTHRVQRVPPGSTVDKLQSSTVNANVRLSPGYS
jgi:peptide chain release factor 1